MTGRRRLRSVNRYVRGLARALVATVLAFALAAGAATADDGAARGAAPGAGVAKPGSAAIGRHAEPRPEDAVFVFNRRIVTFRAPFLGVSARERAIAAHDRIVTVLERGGPGNVSVEKLEPGDAIKIDGALAFVLTQDDVDRLAGETFDSLEADTLRVLEQTIAETREARSGRLMLAAALWAAGATVFYLLLLWVLRRVSRAVTTRMVQVADTTAGQLKIGGSEILQRERDRRSCGDCCRSPSGRSCCSSPTSGSASCSAASRSRAPGASSSTLPRRHDHRRADVGGDVDAGPPGRRGDLDPGAPLNNLLRSFFDGVQSARVSVTWLDADSARPTRRLVTIILWVFALAMAYPYIPGSDSEAFKGLSVLIGLMISIGASGIVGQAASGMILMYTRTFRPGEYVRIADHEGTIVEMGMFTTRLRTGLGEELTMPNSLVLSSVTKNYSRAVKGTGFVVDSTVTIGYDAPWRQVHAMLLEAARRTEGVLPDPAPRVFQTALSDFYVEYRLVARRCERAAAARRGAVGAPRNVQDVFNEHGVQIMSPHYLGDPAQRRSCRRRSGTSRRRAATGETAWKP